MTAKALRSLVDVIFAFRGNVAAPHTYVCFKRLIHTFELIISFFQKKYGRLPGTNSTMPFNLLYTLFTYKERANIGFLALDHPIISFSLNLL